MMERIAKGAKPSAVLRDLLADSQRPASLDIAHEFHERFPLTGTIAMHLIWKWRAPNGLNDDGLDLRLQHLLQVHGYIE